MARQQKSKVVRHPLVTWRDGRPRFTPGPNLRVLGYKSHDLRHDNGKFFSRGEAVDWSAALQKELKRRQLEAFSPQKRVKTAQNLLNLLEIWLKKAVLPTKNGQKQPKIGVKTASKGSFLAKNTQKNYQEKVNLLKTSGFAELKMSVSSLTRAKMRGLYDKIVRRCGAAQAQAALHCISSALSWGILNGQAKLETNPCFRLRMETPAPRLRFAERAEIDALVAAADAARRPEIGDMIILAVWTGQRQSDRFQLINAGLEEGRRIFRQQKTGAIVAIKETPLLSARLAAAAERRRAKSHDNSCLLIDEQTGKAWTRSQYHKIFNEVKAAAAITLPGVADLRDQDLRDTAVTWLAKAGATIPEIISITGHSPQSATNIMRHYLAATPDMADAGITKLENWHNREVNSNAVDNR